MTLLSWPHLFFVTQFYINVYCQFKDSKTKELKDFTWQSIQSQLFSQADAWEKISSTKLMKQFFLNENIDMSSTPENSYSSISTPYTTTTQKQIPLPIEARLIELDRIKDEESSTMDTSKTEAFFNSHHSVAGHQHNIFTFWDDPICDLFVFPRGLYICGDARIRGSLTILSGMNLTNLFDHRYPREAGLPHVQSRCTIDPFKSTQFVSANTRKLFTSSEQQTHTETSNQSIPWCFINLTIRSANVFVLNSVEVYGNLYAKSLRVDAGTSLFVGLRGLIYTNPRLAEFDFSKYAADYAKIEAELPKRRRKKASEEEIENQNTTPSTSQRKTDQQHKRQRRERMSVHQYREMESERKQLFESEWNGTIMSPKKIPGYGEEGYNDENRKEKYGTENEEGINKRPKRFPKWRQSPKYEDLRLTLTELKDMNCPVIDTKGSVLFIDRTRDDNLEVRSDFSPTKRDISGSDAQQSPSQSSWMTYDNWRTIRTQPFGSPNNNFGERYSDANDESYNPYGRKLPYLDGNVTMGDLVIMNSLVAGNSGLVWVFGNLIASGVILDASSHFHAHCGHLFLNITNNIGITVLESSTASFGGWLDSIVPRFVVQHGSDVAMKGSLIAIKYLQVFRASQARFMNEVLTGVISVSEGSTFYADESVEVEMIIDVKDGSNVVLAGSIGVGMFQVEDGSNVNILCHSPNTFLEALEGSGDEKSISQVKTIIAVEDSLIVDGNSHVTIKEASLLIHNSLYIANRSSIFLPMGDVFVIDIGSVHVVSSTLLVGGSLLAPRASVLIGLGSEVTIGGSLRASGITAAEVERLYMQNKEPERPKKSDIELDSSGKKWSWSKKATNAVEVNQYGASSNRNFTIPEKPSTNVSDSTSKLSYDGSGKDEGGIGIDVASESSNVASLKNEGLELTKKARGPRPAIFVESSKLIVNGLLECLNSWIELSRKSEVIVGKGVMSHQTNSTLIRVRLRSSLLVKDGSLVAGVSFLISENSNVRVMNGTVISHGLFEIRSRSKLKAKTLSTMGDTWIAGRSSAIIDGSVQIGGELLSVSQNSQLVSADGANMWFQPELRQKHGDVFVEDSSTVKIHSGNLWVYGSVVSQDRGIIKVYDGNIISVQGDIIAENFSHISASATILLFSAYRHQAHQPSGLDNRINNYTSATQLMTSKALDAPFQGGISDELKKKFYPIGSIRRTSESVVTADRFIPMMIKAEIYIQELPKVFAPSEQPQNETTSPKKSIPTLNTPISLVQESIFSSSSRLQIQNESTPRSSFPSSLTNDKSLKEKHISIPAKIVNTTVTLTQTPNTMDYSILDNDQIKNEKLELSHGVSKLSLQEKLRMKKHNMNELRHPSQWESLVVLQQSKRDDKANNP